MPALKSFSFGMLWRSIFHYWKKHFLILFQYLQKEPSDRFFFLERYFSFLERASGNVHLSPKRSSTNPQSFSYFFLILIIFVKHVFQYFLLDFVNRLLQIVT